MQNQSYTFRTPIVLIAAMLVAITANAIDFPAEEYISHTLPVIYINTEGNTPVTSKEYYLSATCRIDAMGIDEFQSMGSEIEPTPLLIKGRGNNSWLQPKKSYRLKFIDKESPLGLNKNRHFVLLAEWVDGQGRLNWETGLYVAKLMGMAWVPAHIPVELVINGEYMGLYFLSEKIRVGKNRVNIEEQNDNELDPNLVTGGWLCEIDNHDDTPQILVRNRTTGKYMRTTIHSPEELSDVQQNYITNLVTEVDNAIYCKDKTSTKWENYIDIDALARYYVACEIVNQVEGFSGSCYWWKDRGADTKMTFGTMWDFDTSNNSWNEIKFCFENNEDDPIQDRNHWIQEIVKFPRFQQRVRELWKEYCDNSVALVEPHARAFVEKVLVAAQSDINRWGSEYKITGAKNTINRANKYLTRLAERHEWLCEQWAKPVTIPGDANGDGQLTAADLKTIRCHLLGRSNDTISIVNANTYDDDVLDLSDLVGIVRLLYKKDNPNAVLPEAPSIAYGVNDKAISTTAGLTINNMPANNVWFAGMKRDIGLCVSNVPTFTAFSVDVSASASITLADINVNGIDDSRYALYTQKLSPTTTRILGYSNNLNEFDPDGKDGFNPFLTITLKIEDDVPTSGNYISFNNLQLAGVDMLPAIMNGMYIPINVRTKKGDVDGNNMVDIDDVNALINFILKTNGADNFINAYAADVDKNGIIDVDDINIIINTILGF